MADLDYAPPRSHVYAGPEPTADDRNMATLAHVLSIFTWFVGPLVIWLVKKDTSPFAADQAKESLNFQITCLIGYALGAATTPFFLPRLSDPAGGVCVPHRDGHHRRDEVERRYRLPVPGGDPTGDVKRE